MAVRVVQLGQTKQPREGLRLGTVRLLPRGVKKQEYARRHYFDLWLPDLAPSRALVAYARAKPWTDARWATYKRRYLGEMRRPPARRLIALFAALSKRVDFSIGCYCESPARCHRSLLGELLREEGGNVRSRFR